MKRFRLIDKDIDPSMVVEEISNEEIPGADGNLPNTEQFF